MKSATAPSIINNVIPPAAPAYEQHSYNPPVIKRASSKTDQPNLPPAIAPVLLLPPPLLVSPLVSVGSGPEPDEVRMEVELPPGPTVVSKGAGVPVEVELLPGSTLVSEGAGVLVEVELLLGVTVVTVLTSVPVTSGSPIRRPCQ